jgi:hypothetical protein
VPSRDRRAALRHVQMALVRAENLSDQVLTFQVPALYRRASKQEASMDGNIRGRRRGPVWFDWLLLTFSVSTVLLTTAKTMGAF